MTPAAWRLVALALLTAAALAAAGLVVAPGSGDDRARIGAPVLPALADATDRASRLVIAGAWGRLTLERAGPDDWRWQERAGYPAAADRVAAALAGLAGLRLDAPLTTRADRYGRLHLRDIADPDSLGLRIDIEADDRTPLGRLILGRPAVGGPEPALYVRRAFETRAWRAVGEPALPDDPLDWFDRAVLALEPARVRRVLLEPAGELPLRLARVDPEAPFAAGDDELTAGLTEALAALAQDLDWLDVQPLGEAPPPVDFRVALTTADGLVLTLLLSEEGGGLWLRVETDTAAGATAAAAAEAVAIARTTGDWHYRVDSARFAALDAIAR